MATLAGFVFGTVPDEIGSGGTFQPEVSITADTDEQAEYDVVLKGAEWAPGEILAEGTVNPDEWEVGRSGSTVQEKVTVTAPSGPGDYILEVQVTQAGESWSGDSNGSFTVISEQTYTLTEKIYPPEAADAGSGIALNPSGGTYEEGTEVELTAIEAGDWQFAEWRDDVSNHGSQNPITITVNSDMTVGAKFSSSKTPTSLMISNIPSEVNVGEQFKVEGFLEEANFPKNPLENKTINLYIDGQKQADTVTGNMGSFAFNITLGETGNHEVYAEFPGDSEYEGC